MAKSVPAPPYNPSGRRPSALAHDLHGGQWFVDQGRRDARNATWSVMSKLVIFVALVWAVAWSLQ